MAFAEPTMVDQSHHCPIWVPHRHLGLYDRQETMTKISRQKVEHYHR